MVKQKPKSSSLPDFIKKAWMLPVIIHGKCKNFMCQTTEDKTSLQSDQRIFNQSCISGRHIFHEERFNVTSNCINGQPTGMLVDSIQGNPSVSGHLECRLAVVKCWGNPPKFLILKGDLDNHLIHGSLRPHESISQPAQHLHAHQCVPCSHR